MAERKVINKWYPAHFDPSKIPRLRLAKNRQYSIRTMAPFNMICITCGEYIYKGKKFNSRQETVENEDYLGLKIFRFYIKCPCCIAEIVFKTDPEKTDYTLEGGATRNFEAARTAEMLAGQEEKEKEEEEYNNPMKVLENRTKASQREVDMLETLEDLRELKSRYERVDRDTMINMHKSYEEQLKLLLEKEDEKFISSIFGCHGEGLMKRLESQEEDEEPAVAKKVMKKDQPTYIIGGERDHKNKTSEKRTSKASLIKKKQTRVSLGVVIKSKPSHIQECIGFSESSTVNTDNTLQQTKKNGQHIDSTNETVGKEYTRQKAWKVETGGKPALCALQQIESYSDSDTSDNEQN